MAQAKKPKNEIGESGTVVFGGIISQEEYNENLFGTRGLKMYDEMRRSDGTVKAALLAVKLPITSATWTVKAHGDTEEDLRAAAFIDHCVLQRMTFTDTLRQILTHLEFGYSVFEQVFEPIVYEGKDYVGLQKLAYRKQDTIYSWEMENGDAGVTQHTLTGGNVSIPMQKLCVFTHDKEGDNYEGISILRAAYQHWYFKKVFYKIDAIAHERQGLGVPVLRVPANASDTDKSKARSLLKNMRANEEAYLELPEGFEVEFLDMKGKQTRDIMPSITHHDRQITKNVLAQFLEIGAQGSSGSFAASADQSALFMMSLQAIAKNISDVLNTTLVSNLIKLNGFNVTEMPTIEVEKISDENVKDLSDALQKLSSSGYVTPDNKLEMHLRKLFRLPEMEDPDNEQDRTVKTPPETEKPVKPKADKDDLDNEEVDDAIKEAAEVHKRIGKVLAKQHEQKSRKQ